MHEMLMREAILEAKKAPGEVPVGAVLVKDGQIIARAHNEREDEHFDPCAHAEILALRRGAEALKTRRLAGCTMYVTLEPCPMCAGAMSLAGIDMCVFGAFDENQGCCGSVYDLSSEKKFYHRYTACGGVLEEECAALTKDFFQSKR